MDGIFLARPPRMVPGWQTRVRHIVCNLGEAFECVGVQGNTGVEERRRAAGWEAISARAQYLDENAG